VQYFLGYDQTTGYPAWLALPGLPIVRIPAIASGAILFAPTLTGIVSLPFVASEAVLLQPVVIAPQDIALSTIVSASTLSSPTVSIAQTVELASLASGAVLFALSLDTPIIDLTEPWGEVARQESTVGGKLTISGLNLSNITVVRLFITGVRVTDDDSQLFLRYIIDGTEYTGSDYLWTTYGAGSPVASPESAISLTPSAAAAKVGNASTESYDGVVTIHGPALTLPKLAYVTGAFVKPDGSLGRVTYGAGKLNASGKITGVVIYGSSDLVAGNLILLGVE
jgi:hypothetical protein